MSTKIMPFTIVGICILFILWSLFSASIVSIISNGISRDLPLYDYVYLDRVDDDFQFTINGDKILINNKLTGAKSILLKHSVKDNKSSYISIEELMRYSVSSNKKSKDRFMFKKHYVGLGFTTDFINTTDYFELVRDENLLTELRVKQNVISLNKGDLEFIAWIK